MLELVAASTIISIALVPALRLTRDSMTQVERLEFTELRASLCVSKLEQALSETAGLWDLTQQTGNFASQGCDEIRFTLTRSDATNAGGIPGKLAVIKVVVWRDEDGDGVLDFDEAHTDMTTKVARLLSYHYETTLN